MNWRAIPPALLWFTLLGPLMMAIVAAIGMMIGAIELGPSMEGNYWVWLVTLPYSYMLFGAASFMAGLIFGVIRGLSSGWLATRAGALLTGAIAGVMASSGEATASEFVTPPFIALSIAIGALIGALCGLFVHHRQARAQRAKAAQTPSA